MMEKKKGWIRILESAVAVMLMIGFFTIIAMKHVALPDVSEEVYQLERAVLKEVSESEQVRLAVLMKQAEEVHTFIKRRLSPTISSAVRICDPDAIDCSFPEAGTPYSYPSISEKPEVNVYTDDYLISSCLLDECQDLDPQLLRLFVWFDEYVEGTPAINYCQNTVLDLAAETELPEDEQCDNTATPSLSIDKCKDYKPTLYVLGNLSCQADCLFDEMDCDACDLKQIRFEGIPEVFEDYYIKYYAFDEASIPEEPDFYITTYNPNGEMIGTDSVPIPVLAADGLTPLYTADLLWPSEAGSLITIRYDNICQDSFVVSA